MLYRSRASVVGSMPHSYGSSFTLLYFCELSRPDTTRVNRAKPVATTTKIAMGMYDESIGSRAAPEEQARRERSRWFITCDLRGVKNATYRFQTSLAYTAGMPLRRLLTAAAVAALFAISPATPRAQALQRAMYVSVLNEAGAPVPGLGPSDFIVREDNVAREVLNVAPAIEPMQIAVLVDNSVAARNYISDMRNALREFVTALTAPSETTGRNQLALIALADRPTTLTDYTLLRAPLLKGIDRIFAVPQSGTLLLEALIEVSKAFKTKGIERPVIVAITTE